MKKISLIIVLITAVYLINKIDLTKQTIDNPCNVDLTPACTEYEKYFVVTRDKPLQVGEDIIVKYKKNKEQKINCEYVVRWGDFEFKGESPDHFKSIYKKYIVIDIGTSIERRFSVYDLDTREEIYKNNIHGSVNISDNLLTFRVVASEIPDKNNCPNYNEIKSMGGGIVFYKYVTFDLDTLKETISDKKECAYAQ